MDSKSTDYYESVLKQIHFSKKVIKSSKNLDLTTIEKSANFKEISLSFPFQ